MAKGEEKRGTGVPKYPAFPVFIVDDEQEAVQGVRYVLRSGGLTNLISCTDSREVMAMLAEHEVGVVLLDLRMPHVSGEELLDKISHTHPEIPAIVVTGANEVEVAVRCMQAGAFDYMVKPVEENRMISGVRRAIELREVRAEYSAFKRRVLLGALEHEEAFSEIVTGNATMRSMFQYMETIAGTNEAVLITGETGVGKELVAQTIHRLSERPGPLVSVNVAGLEDSILADTLFGHIKGAYTGADTMRSGLIEQASGGTLFLDEIGDLSTHSQVMLLRVLQEREYFPLGGDVPKRTNARIVVATNRDLAALQEEGRFRADFYYRLKTHHIHVPPFRERLDDLPLLVDYFLEKAAQTLGKKRPTAPRELYALLATYHFPGNIRELESMVFDAISQHQSKTLSLDRFKSHIQAAGPRSKEALGAVEGGASAYALFERLPTLAEAPKLLLAEAMRRAEGNQSLAAQLLGITQSGLNKALKRAGF